VASFTVPVRLVSKSTPRSRLINLDLTGAPFAFRAGQAVMVGLHGSPLRKPYSIASAPWEVEKFGTLQLLTQVDDTSSLDPHLELATPGTLLDVEGPFGSFGLPGDGSTPLLFVAGGTGIAPLRSMIIQRLARGAAPPMALVYSARSADEFAFLPELRALEAAGRLKTLLTVTRDERDEWEGRRGRIDEPLLKDALPAPDSVCFICGPPQLVNATAALLDKIGIADEAILIEKY